MQSDDTHREIIRRLKACLGEFSNHEIAELNHVVTAEVNQRLTSGRQDSPDDLERDSGLEPRFDLSLALPPSFEPEAVSKKTAVKVVKHHYDGLGVGLTDTEMLNVAKSGEFNALLSSSLMSASDIPSGVGRKAVILQRQRSLNASWRELSKTLQPFREGEDLPKGSSEPQTQRR